MKRVICPGYQAGGVNVFRPIATNFLIDGIETRMPAPTVRGRSNVRFLEIATAPWVP